MNPLESTLTYPSHQIDGGQTIRDDFLSSQELETMEREKRLGLLASAQEGDEMGKLMLQKYLRLTGWYTREQGDIVGCLSQEVERLERRGILKESKLPMWQDWRR